MGAGCGALESSLRQLMKFGAQRGADITGEVETIHGISFVRIASQMHAAVKQEAVPSKRMLTLPRVQFKWLRAALSEFGFLQRQIL
jgi:hypothetical protein